MFILLVSLLIFLMMGIPIAYSLGLSSLSYFLIAFPNLINVLPQRLFSGVDSFALIALPMFILMGYIMNSTGITDRLLRFCSLFVGKLRGGLGLVNVFSSMIFGGISGSSTSDIASIGSILIPAMEKRGYSKAFSAGLTVASSTMGMIIPPSIPMILYAITAEESVGKLFLGGLVPGVLVGAGQLILVFVLAHYYKYPTEQVDTSFANILKETQNSFPIVLMPIIVVGSVVFGIATATESAVVGVVYATLLALFFIRKLSFKNFYESHRDAAYTASKIMLIIALSQIYIWVLALEQVPEQITSTLNAMELSQLEMLILINVIILIAGTFIDVSPAILLLTPVLLPSAVAAGVDPIHFGVILVSGLAVGACTPPVGNCLNVCSVVAQMSIGKIFLGALPFLILNVIVLLLISIFPEIVLWIPRAVFG